MLFRRATMDDAALLLAWRNDPLTRAMSHDSGEVSRDGHLQWLSRSIAMPWRTLYIASKNDVPVGTFRIDTREELSWTISPEHRGQGHCKEMMLRAMAGRLCPFAQIKDENHASRAVAAFVGLKPGASKDGITEWTW